MTLEEVRAFLAEQAIRIDDMGEMMRTLDAGFRRLAQQLRELMPAPDAAFVPASVIVELRERADAQRDAKAELLREVLPHMQDWRENIGVLVATLHGPGVAATMPPAAGAASGPMALATTFAGLGAWLDSLLGDSPPGEPPSKAG